MQTMNDSQPDTAQEAQPQEPPQLEPPFDMLFMLRPMLPPREQKMIDLILKMQEIKILMCEIQSGI